MNLERPKLVTCSFDGILGERLIGNRRNWLLVAPLANPAMVEMFDHSITPSPPADVYLPWSGEYAGKYLISAVQDLRMSHDPILTRTVSEVADALVAYQGEDGYLGTYDLKDRIFGPNWDVWNHYHCVLGLFEWFRYSGAPSALDACRKATAYLCLRLPSAAEIGTLHDLDRNLAFAHAAALLYQEVGEQRYLDLLHAFEVAWAAERGGVDFVEVFQTPSTLYDAAGRGQRWERLHCLQAVGELFRITGDERYLTAFTNAWQGIRRSDRHSTGGFSSLELATANPFDPRPIETCATVAWMALTVDMLRLSGSAEAADELELSTWNAGIGAQGPAGKWWTYDTPMGGISTVGMKVMEGLPPPMHVVPAFGGTRRPTPYDLGFQDKAGTSYLSCCAANGPRALGVLSEWAVMSATDGIAVNFYGPSSFTLLTPAGNEVTVEQRTNYPLDGAVRVLVHPAQEERFAMLMRIPGWSARGTIAVNTESAEPASPGTYHRLDRTWRPGDSINLALDLTPRLLLGAPRPAGSDPDSGAGAEGRMAIYRGPILFAYDERRARFTVDSLPPITEPLQFEVSAPSPRGPAGRIVTAQVATSMGPLELSDFASAGMPDPPASANIDVDGRIFQFGREDGSIIAQRIRLAADGTIEGYSSQDEFRWSWDAGFPAFYTSDGRLSTRFVWQARENDHAVLRGRFEFDGRIIHTLREVDLAVERRWFRFSRRDGSLLAARLRLLPDGLIDGHSHPNEARWGLEGDVLVFYAEDGTATTRFTETRVSLGRVDFVGEFVQDASITHELSELDVVATDKIWQFRRPPGPGGISIRLLRDGRIESADNANETYWKSEDGAIVFCDAARLPTTRFTSLDKDADGRMRWAGPFLPDPTINHELAEWNADLDWGESGQYISWLPRT
jgi:DUF1680 family protein